MKKSHIISGIALYFALVGSMLGEDIERARPAEWKGLITGGRFMDRFLPLPEVGELSSNVWGMEGVKPRHVDNGIEDAIWSYWGGNIHVDSDGSHHMFVCRWAEDAERGHMAWPHSEVVHAVSDNSIGPFTVKQVIGKGHNPEVQQLSDGRYFLYVNRSYYIADHLNGPWEKHEFTFDARQRPIDDHMANNTFVMRADGSMLMVGRGGGVWISETGLPPYRQITSESVYPPYEGRYEDPVVWKTDVQYHLIVNDWFGRIAYYMRSKDGVTWKLDAGEAYLPGIAKHADGRVEEWYKFERIKVLQDQYGRAYQANFAVCDTVKRQDLGSDNHSSKNIAIPLTVGRLIELKNQRIDSNTKQLQVLVKAEPGFDPIQDMNIESLRFGASEEVDYGRGCKLMQSEQLGADMLLTFSAEGHGLTDENFAAKLLGKTTEGQLLYGFSRLPWVNYKEPILSSLLPEFTLNSKNLKGEVEIENFGFVDSEPAELLIEYHKEGKWKPFGRGTIPALKPYEIVKLSVWGKQFSERNQAVQVRVTLDAQGDAPVVFVGWVVLR